MPGEVEQSGRGRRRARGIQDGDWLPACDLSREVSVASIELSLAVMEFGAEDGSWTDRMLRLRDAIGPFRLAYLEMLLRIADETASAEPHLEASCHAHHSACRMHLDAVRGYLKALGVLRSNLASRPTRMRAARGMAKRL